MPLIETISRIHTAINHALSVRDAPYSIAGHETSPEQHPSERLALNYSG